MPLSLAAALSLLKVRKTPGVPSESIVKEMSSVPKNVSITREAAPLNVLCPDVYSGKLGVTSIDVQVASFSVASLPSRSALRMAVTGRQKFSVYLQSQQRMPASASA